MNRLKEAEAEERIWPTQFGFRRKHSTEHALLIARRQIERAWSSKSESVRLVALDWAKAFDCIDPEGLLRALRRFGIPENMVEMIADIYADRQFRVVDCGETSKLHAQRFGVCQGCPLSPFLCTIVMTCVMHDSRRQLLQTAGKGVHDSLSDLLYADDTLLFGVSASSLGDFLAAVADSGAEYGLSLNVSKTQLMNIRTGGTVEAPGGQVLQQKESMVYLGGLLHSDGKADHELSRRIGLAAADFKSLARVWTRSSLSRARKLRIFESCVLSVLVYGLKTAWLGAVARRRLDGFHARCLRKIMGIPPAYFSRISNASVFSSAGCKPSSNHLLQQQLFLFGDIATSPPGPLRASVFLADSLSLIEDSIKRGRGRPRHTWAKQLMAVASKIAGGKAHLESLIAAGSTTEESRSVVKAYLYFN